MSPTPKHFASYSWSFEVDYLKSELNGEVKCGLSHEYLAYCQPSMRTHYWLKSLLNLSAGSKGR